MVWELLRISILWACIIFVAYRIGYRHGQRATPHWLVRPHTSRTLARMPMADPDAPEALATVQQATFVRDNLPGSTSKME